MDFQSDWKQIPDEQKVRGWNGPLPFYMTCSGYLRPEQNFIYGGSQKSVANYLPGSSERNGSLEKEAQMLRDLEYLQQLYPAEIRHCQKRIEEIVDRTDYAGSMIYDEYPDRYTLRALAESICKSLAMEGNPPSSEVVQILLYNEIYKRRHNGRRDRYFVVERKQISD